MKIVDQYDPVLKQKATPWVFSVETTRDLNQILSDMVRAMSMEGGIGLAANQVGLPHAMFVMGSGGQFTAVINPEILEKTGEQKEIEGCLSYPGLFMNVKRAQHIKVKFYDIEGNPHEEVYEGLTARVFLHEFDHLQGVRFQERVPYVIYVRAKDKVKANLKRIAAHRSEMMAKHAGEIKAKAAAMVAAKRNPVSGITIEPMKSEVSGDVVLDLGATGASLQMSPVRNEVIPRGIVLDTKANSEVLVIKTG